MIRQSMFTGNLCVFSCWGLDHVLHGDTMHHSLLSSNPCLNTACSCSFHPQNHPRDRVLSPLLRENRAIRPRVLHPLYRFSHPHFQLFPNLFASRLSLSPSISLSFPLSPAYSMLLLSPTLIFLTTSSRDLCFLSWLSAFYPQHWNQSDLSKLPIKWRQPLLNTPSDWLARLYDAAVSPLALPLVTFPCSLHTDSILKKHHIS